MNAEPSEIPYEIWPMEKIMEILIFAGNKKKTYQEKTTQFG